MKHSNPNILYYMAIGDAYCLGCEYISHDHENIEELLKFEKYIPHPKYPGVPGSYSDDTQMSIANAEALINFGSDVNNYSPIVWASHWVNTFHRDPRKGYSSSFQKFLEAHDNGAEFIKNINAVSNKNGAAMRSPILGVLKSHKDVLKLAEQQAAVTHNTLGGIFASKAVALMSHYCLWSGSPLTRIDLGEFMIDNLGHDLLSGGIFKDVFIQPWNGRIADFRESNEIGIATAWSVFELLVSCNSLKEILEQTIKWGGDTDSVAAIAMAIGSARLEDDLPKFLHDDLENNKYGSVFLRQLGQKVMIYYG